MVNTLKTPKIRPDPPIRDASSKLGTVILKNHDLQTKIPANDDFDNLEKSLSNHERDETA